MRVILIFVTALVLFIACFPYLATHFITRYARNAFALHLTMDGLAPGRTIHVERVVLRPFKTVEPLVTISQLVISPSWRSLLSSEPRFKLVSAASVEIRWDTSAETWMNTLKRDESARVSWKIDRAAIEKIVCFTPWGRIDGRLNATGLAPDGADIAEIKARLNDTLVALTIVTDTVASSPRAHRVRAEGPDLIRLVQSAGLISLLPQESAALAGRWFIEGELPSHYTAEPKGDDAKSPFQKNMRLLKQIAALKIRGGIIDESGAPGASLSLLPVTETMVAFSVQAGGRIGGCTGLLYPDSDALNFLFARGEEFCRGTWVPAVESLHLIFNLQLPPMRELECHMRGEAEITGLGSINTMRVKGAGNTEGRYTGTKPPVLFEAQWVAAKTETAGWNIGMKNLRALGKHRANAWRVDCGELEIEWNPREWTLVLRNRAEVAYGPHKHEIAGAFRMNRDGEGVFENLLVSGVPLAAKIVLTRKGELQSARIAFDSVTLPSLAHFLPRDAASLLTRCRSTGSIGGEFTYSSSKEVTGELRVDIEELSDSISGFLLHRLKARIPIRQRFVSAEDVRFDEQTRWPDVPVNVRIGRIGRENIVAENLEGRALFSDFVFRARDVRFRILESEARCRLVLDPFRNKEGRWRTALEFQMESVPLRAVYENFVGKGKAAARLQGGLTCFLETAWADTECLVSRGSIRAPARGRISREVIAALVEMLPKGDRPPGLVMALVGDYDYDTFVLTLDRDGEIKDFQTVVLLESKREFLLGRFRLAAPLLTLVEKLPYDVKSDIHARKSRRARIGR